MKKTIKLIPAIVMLLVSAILVSTSTYAWFSMNNRVTVTGMTVTTKVSSNLLISADNSSAASYGNNLTQARAALLEPSSTINGINYFYTSTSNVDAKGDAKTEAYTAYAENTNHNPDPHTAADKTAYDAGFNTAYGITTPTATPTGVAYGYVDYTFYLKAVNTETTPQQIRLTNLNLLYNGAAVSEKAWRVALISQDASAITEYTPLNTAPTSANVVSLFALNGATNFETGKAVASTTETGTLNYGDSKTAYNQAGVVGEVAVGTTAYYKVTVRLWLEGEDTTCTSSTFATLTNNYTLDLAFEFATGTAAVTTIQSAPVVTP